MKCLINVVKFSNFLQFKKNEKKRVEINWKNNTNDIEEKYTCWLNDLLMFAIYVGILDDSIDVKMFSNFFNLCKSK